MRSTATSLPDDLSLLKAMLLAERAESERLRQIIRELQRHRFGRRAESLPEEQLQFALEEAEQIEAAGFAKTEGPAERKARAAKRRANRGALPSHLPRIEMVVDVASTICPGCSGTLHRIGEDVSERLDIVPAQFRVLVVRRPKYACRTCEDLVVQASAPARLIEGGLPTEATIAQVLVSKYADHLPLYRQAQIYARQGVNLDRSTLADWVGRAAFLLRPVHQRLLDRLKASSKLFADETTAPVLDPGHGRTKTGQLFAYVSLKFDARRQTGGCPRRIELGRVAVADSHGKLGRRHERSHKLTIVETLSGSGMPVLSSFANCSGTTGRLK